MREYERLREKIMRYPDAKFGFVVYRCTYKDEESWKKFMEYLDAHTRWQLEEAGIGDLYLRLDWNVQEDPQLEDASEIEVRRRFRQWIEESHEPNHPTARYHACVMVEENDVDWVVHRNPLPPNEDDNSEMLSVTLVSKRYEGHRDPDESDDEEEEDDGFGDFDPNKPLQPYAESDDADGNASESTPEPKAPKDKVSSEQIGLSYLVPRVWSLLDGAGWHSIADDRKWR